MRVGEGFIPPGKYTVSGAGTGGIYPSREVYGVGRGHGRVKTLPYKPGVNGRLAAA